MRHFATISTAFLLCLVVAACGSSSTNDGDIDSGIGSGSGGIDDGAGDDDGGGDGTDDNAAGDCSTLHNAYAEFGANVDVLLNSTNCTVTIEATGKPDHASPYWATTNPLYEAPEDQATFDANRSPGDIDRFGTQLYTLTVPTTPELAATSTATSLGAVGIAVSGSPIFNDQEGPNINLDFGVIMGFDKNGAHTGPEVYHYHLEPKSISDDDSALIGVMADGFFIYGRKCESTNTYPTDLDESGGHVSVTQHSNTPHYHYHVKDEFYLNSYYLLFPGNYQGTPASISR